MKLIVSAKVKLIHTSFETVDTIITDTWNSTDNSYQ